jgi:hypothetical protein
MPRGYMKKPKRGSGGRGPLSGDSVRKHGVKIRPPAQIRYRGLVRIANLSRVHTNTGLAPIVHFAAQFYKHSHLAVVVVNDTDSPVDHSKGETIKEANWDNPEPSCIKLWLNSSQRYPLQQSNYVPEVPVPAMRTWHEETLFTLAHEMQHIDDLWDGWLADKDTKDLRYLMEVRAEKKACEVLEAWRKQELERQLLPPPGAIPFQMALIDRRLSDFQSRRRRPYGKVAAVSA